jgi:hypothetical protein
MADHPPRPFFRRFGVVFGVIVAGFIGVVLIAAFLPHKPSLAAAALDAKLAQLRSDGVPLSSDELATAFPDPDPEHDGRQVLRDALAWAPRGDASPLLPIVGRAPMPSRTEAIPEPVMEALSAHLSNSDAILEAIPKQLSNVWFSTGWARGVATPTQLPSIEIRALSQTLALKAIYEAELRHGAKAADALEKGYAVMSTLRGDSLFTTMIRVACALIICDATEQSLNHVKFDDRELMRIVASVPTKVIDDFESALTVERALMASFLIPLRQVHDSINQDRIRLASWRLMNLFRGSRKPLYRDEDFLLFLNTIDEMKKLGSKPMLERIHETERVTAQFSTNAQSTAVAMFFPNLTKAMRSACEAKARLVALETAVAIERFRLANNNALPPTLDALVPKYSASPPRDPFDERPLRYKALARGYVVYSIGADGADNGGIERTENQKIGYDVTITVER